MASRREPSDILARLSAASSAGIQAAALRDVKDDIIGHEQKKEEWIRLGLVPQLVRILSAPLQPKRSNAAFAVTEPASSAVVGRDTNEEAARLQATIIAGSLAHGGPAFVAPLLSSTIVVSLLASLSPVDASSRLVLETLRTLNAIADALSLLLPPSKLQESSLSDILYSATHVHRFKRVLGQRAITKPIVQQQISLAASLVAKTCRNEPHRSTLARAGVLDALGSQLASFVLSTGCVTPQAPEAEPKPRRGRRSHHQVLMAAPASGELYPILDAITSIIHCSKFRGAQLLYSPDIMALLPPLPRSATTTSIGSTVESSFSTIPSIIDFLLPQVPYTPKSKYSPVHHPKRTPYIPSNFSVFAARPSEAPSGVSSGAESAPVGSAGPTNRSAPSPSGHHGNRPPIPGEEAEEDDDESPLVSWLIYIARQEHGINRLMAISVLSELSRLGLVSKNRDTMLALLIVPLLVRMLDDSGMLLSRGVTGRPPSNDPKWVTQTVKERAPAVLAMLVTDSVELQKAAVDADAIKKLSAMLKAAYHAASDASHGSSWTARTDTDMEHGDEQRSAAETRLGDAGISRTQLHRLRVRESALEALASLAPFQDEYRKMIIDNGVTPFLLESLKPYDHQGAAGAAAAATNTGPAPSPASRNDDKQQASGPAPTAGHSVAMQAGNPVSVLVAACDLVQGLSRSVSILRTSLIDAGIALPIFNLLTHPDIEVQIAATKVHCNILLEFSPMRETLMQAGAVKVLCAHAHSSNVSLRLNAIWALKHLVLAAENAVKIACMEQLGHGWLIQLICGDTGDNATSSIMSSANSYSATSSSFTAAPSRLLMDSSLRVSSSSASYMPDYSDEGDEDDEDEDDENVHMADYDDRAKETISFLSSSSSYNARHESRATASHISPAISGRSKLSTLSPSALVAARLEALREAEADTAAKAREDELAVQEQGLDFIRNIIFGQGRKREEMIDFLLNSLGAERLFRILEAKIRFGLADRPTAATATASPSSSQHAHDARVKSNLSGNKAKSNKSANSATTTASLTGGGVGVRGGSHIHGHQQSSPSSSSASTSSALYAGRKSQNAASSNNRNSGRGASSAAEVIDQLMMNGDDDEEEEDDNNDSTAATNINNDGDDDQHLLLLPRPEIAAAVCYILVNIAAGHTRHRQLLIEQTSLLQRLVPLFAYPAKEVRGALAWVVINLTSDDDADNGNSPQHQPHQQHHHPHHQQQQQQQQQQQSHPHLHAHSHSLLHPHSAQPPPPPHPAHHPTSPLPHSHHALHPIHYPPQPPSTSSTSPSSTSSSHRHAHLANPLAGGPGPSPLFASITTSTLNLTAAAAASSPLAAAETLHHHHHPTLNTNNNHSGGSSSSSNSNRMLSCRARALELHRLGFQTALESLADDVELDVKERSRIALSMLKKHVGSI